MPYSTRLQIIFRWVKRKLLYNKCGDAWTLHKVSMDFAQFSSSEVIWLEIFKLDMKWEFLCSSLAGTIAGHLLLKQIKGCLRNPSRDETFKTARWLWLWDHSENKSVVLENDQGKKTGKKRNSSVSKLCLEQISKPCVPRGDAAITEWFCTSARVLRFSLFSPKYLPMWEGRTNNPQQRLKNWGNWCFVYYSIQLE